MKHIISTFLLSLYALRCLSPTGATLPFSTMGIDVSHYQSYIDWKAVSQQDIQFAFIKATEGNEMIDTLFCRNWTDIRGTQIKRGAYHFFRPSLDPVTQFNNFASTVDLQIGDFPPVLDIEVIDGASDEKILAGVRTWLMLAEQQYKVKPILYTSLRYYYKLLASEFPNYPIWIARYDPKDPTLEAGNNWHFWQFDNKGTVKGIKGPVDLNVFNSTNYNLKDLSIMAAPRIREIQTP